jgi:hypothetical protein
MPPRRQRPPREAGAGIIGHAGKGIHEAGLLALEDGTVFWGKPFGTSETFGEVVLTPT